MNINILKTITKEQWATLIFFMSIGLWAFITKGIPFIKEKIYTPIKKRRNDFKEQIKKEIKEVIDEKMGITIKMLNFIAHRELIEYVEKFEQKGKTSTIDKSFNELMDYYKELGDGNSKSIQMRWDRIPFREE